MIKGFRTFLINKIKDHINGGLISPTLISSRSQIFILMISNSFPVLVAIVALFLGTQVTSLIEPFLPFVKAEEKIASSFLLVAVFVLVNSGIVYFLKKWNIKDYILKLECFLSLYILTTVFNKRKTVDELNDYFDLYLKELGSHHTVSLKSYDLMLNKIQQELNPLSEFVRKNFSSSKSLTKFLGERYKYANEVNYYLVIFSLLIPRRNSLPLDMLKSIISSAQQHQSDRYIFHIHSKTSFLYDQSAINEVFSEYSDLEIKTLFTNYYNPNQFMELLQMCEVYFYKGKKIPKFKNMYEILGDEEKPLFNSRLLKPIEHPHFYFKVLRTRGDYVVAKKEFHNCVLDYFNQLDDVITVHMKRNKKSVACVSLDRKGVTTIRGPYNEIIIKEIENNIGSTIFNHIKKNGANSIVKDISDFLPND